MRENLKLSVSGFSFLFLPGNVKLHLKDWHLALFPNPINFSMLPKLCEGWSKTLLADWKPLSAALCLDKFPLWVLWAAADFLAGNCGSALAEILLSVVEEMTFYSADMSFLPPPFLSGTQPPHCCHCRKSTRNQMSLGCLSKKRFLK